jgi:hypothetical protein
MTEQRQRDAAGRARSPATMPGYHTGRPPRNKGLRYPADPPRVEEIVAVMRQAGTGAHGANTRSDRRPVACGTPHQRSARPGGGRPRSAARRPSDPSRKGRQAARVRHGRLGLGAASPVARAPCPDARGAALLHSQWAYPRATMVGLGCESAASPSRSGSRRPAPVRASSTTPRARGRDGARRRGAERDPATTRACRPRCDLGLSARDRQHRGHQHHSCTTRADHARERGTSHLTNFPTHAPRAKHQRGSGLGRTANETRQSRKCARLTSETDEFCKSHQRRRLKITPDR